MSALQYTSFFKLLTKQMNEYNLSNLTSPRSTHSIRQTTYSCCNMYLVSCRYFMTYTYCNSTVTVAVRIHQEPNLKTGEILSYSTCFLGFIPDAVRINVINGISGQALALFDNTQHIQTYNDCQELRQFVSGWVCVCVTASQPNILHNLQWKLGMVHIKLVSGHSGSGFFSGSENLSQRM